MHSGRVHVRVCVCVCTWACAFVRLNYRFALCCSGTPPLCTMCTHLCLEIVETSLVVVVVIVVIVVVVVMVVSG